MKQICSSTNSMIEIAFEYAITILQEKRLWRYRKITCKNGKITLATDRVGGL